MTKLLAKLMTKKSKTEEKSEQEIVQMALLMRVDRVLQVQASQRHIG